MPLFVIAAAFAVSVSIPRLWWALASDRSQPRAVVAQADSVGQAQNTRRLILEEGAAARVISPAVRSVGESLLKLTPVGWIASLRRNLVLGGTPGDSYALERTLVLKFLSGLVGFLLGYLLTEDLASAQRIAVSALLAGFGFFLPDVFVSRRGRQRQQRIQLEMPDTFDQLTMSVEAGLGFEAALTRAARAGDGPFAEEIHRTLREIQLGISRTQALQNLADRTEVTDLDSFVLAVTQSEKYGIAIGQVLRVQSEELREKRRQRAEERALKIPLKMIFPLAFCIFPAIFIIILGPVGIRIFSVLGSV
jgi:tight adherence protein C